jgi:pyruvate-ferredoxin/flavodoxin oxidoreductase
VCPHAAIRSFLIADEDAKKVPVGLTTKAAMGVPGAQFAVQCSPLDCTGCESCARVCIAKEKALTMKPLRESLQQQESNWTFVQSIKQVPHKFNVATVKGIQFNKPYFEFSGACAGCGETPYVTLISRLFGESMIVANATGCSSIYGGSAPSNPYTIDENGHGPSWANSLFEDNAEFGYGMQLATAYQRNEAYALLDKIAKTASSELANAINDLIANKNTTGNVSKITNVVALLKKEINQTPEIKKVIATADQLSKKST